MNNTWDSFTNTYSTSINLKNKPNWSSLNSSSIFYSVYVHNNNLYIKSAYGTDGNLTNSNWYKVICDNRLVQLINNLSKYESTSTDTKYMNVFNKLFYIKFNNSYIVSEIGFKFVDYKNRYIMVSNSSNNVFTTGGNDSAPHTHTVTSNTQHVADNVGSGVQTTMSVNSSTGSTSISIQPKYVMMNFIIKCC